MTQLTYLTLPVEDPAPVKAWYVRDLGLDVAWECPHFMLLPRTERTLAYIEASRPPNQIRPNSTSRWRTSMPDAIGSSQTGFAFA